MLGASSVAIDAQDQGLRRTEVLWLMAILGLGTATVLFYTRYLIIGTGKPISQAGVYVRGHCNRWSGRLGDCSPRLPRIRTCHTIASGSSAHGFTT
jgi:hypothetical protein